MKIVHFPSVNNGGFMPLRVFPSLMVLVSIAMITIGVTACSPSATSKSNATHDSTVICDPNSGVGIDSAVCDDLNETYSDHKPSKPSCDLADGSDIFTTAFAEVADTRAELRCLVPRDADLLEAYRSYGAKIDGIADVQSPGDPGYLIFYAGSNDVCLATVAYWPGTDNWSSKQTSNPQPGDARYATPLEAAANSCLARN